MFTNHLFYKGLIYRIYEELLQLKNNKNDEKLGNDLSKHVSIRDIETDIKYMKRCSTLFVIKKM